MQNRSFRLAFPLLLMLSSCSMQHNINKMSGVYRAIWMTPNELKENIHETLILYNNQTYIMLCPSAGYQYRGFWSYTESKQIKLTSSPLTPALTLLDRLEGGYAAGAPNFSLSIVDKNTLSKARTIVYYKRFSKVQRHKNTNYGSIDIADYRKLNTHKYQKMAGVYEYKPSAPDTSNPNPIYLILRPSGKCLTMQRHHTNDWGEWLYTSPRTLLFTTYVEEDTTSVFNNRTVHVVNKNVLQLDQPDSIVFTRVKTRLF